MVSPAGIIAEFTKKMQLAAKSAANAFWPGCDDDYIRIRGVMVAKPLLAAALLAANLILAVLIIILLCSAPVTLKDGARAYKHSSIRLRGYTGVATVLDGNKNPIYTGDLLKGKATGYGELKDRDGNPVYSGAFLENRYNGEGELYYPSGTVKYCGEFKNNLFDGTGMLYYPSGAKYYEGGFSSGKKQGGGILFGAPVGVIYNGIFVDDNIFFAGYVGGESQALGDFGGERVLYTGAYDISAALREFGVIYVLEASGTDEAAATVARMYDVSGIASRLPEPCAAGALREALGEPFYAGWADILVPDLAAIEELKRMGRLSRSAGPAYELSPPADGIYEVTYPPEQRLYLESYNDGEWFYTYYFFQSAEPYLFYSLERAGNLNSGE